MKKREDRAVSAERIKTTIRVDKAIWKAVQHTAIREDLSAEQIVTYALLDYLEKPKKGGK
jgi:predicted DNA-binding ribbon-helix-helix protein